MAKEEVLLPSPEVSRQRRALTHKQYMNELQKQFNILPKKVKDHFLSAPVGEVVRNLAATHKLSDEQAAVLDREVVQVLVAVVGIVALAAGIAGFLFGELRPGVRIALFTAAALLLSPDVEVAGRQIGVATNVAGGSVFMVAALVNWLGARATAPATGAAAAPAVADRQEEA
jgi:hypothetical protein